MDTVSTAAEKSRERWAPDVDAETPIERACQVGTVIAVVIIGIVGLIGILVFDQVFSSIPTSSLEADDGTRNEFGTAVDGLVEGFGGAMELLPIVLLVLISALVIQVVQRMRSSGM
jgi:hypothetical protein